MTHTGIISKKIRIRTLFYIFSTLIIFSTFCAFAAESSKVLTFWTSGENVKKAMLKSAGQFEKDYGLKVVIEVLNKELTSKFRTAALTGNGPDSFVWAHDQVGNLAASGLIEPIILPPNLKKAFLPVALKAFTYNGRLYGYPYDMEAVALIYNKDLVKKVPKTMEELVILAKSISKKHKGKFGFLYDFKSFFFSYAFISANGGYIFKNTGGKLNVGDIGLANPGALKGVTFLSKLAKEGVIPVSTDRSIAFNKMKKGELAMTIDGPWALADLRKSGIKYGIAPIPSLNGKTARPFVGSHGFIIRRSSPNKKMAKEFIENYLMTKEGIINLYREDPRGPSRIDAIAELGSKDPDLKNFMKSVEVGVPMPNIPEMGAVWGSMGDAIQLVINGRSTPKEALNAAKNQIIKAVSK